MKKVVCILILICVILGAAFAQQKPATPAPAPAPAKPAAPAPAPTPAAAPAASSGKVNAIGLDVFQLLRGVIESDSDRDYSVFIIAVNYERLISPHYSIGAALDLGFITIGSGNTKKENKYLNLSAEGRYYPSSVNFDKFFLGATLGYCQLSADGSTQPAKGGYSGLSTSVKMGYKVITEKGLYLEPALAYEVQKSSLGSSADWNVGLRLGWAF